MPYDDSMFQKCESFVVLDLIHNKVTKKGKQVCMYYGAIPFNKKAIITSSEAESFTVTISKWANGDVEVKSEVILQDSDKVYSFIMDENTEATTENSPIFKKEFRDIRNQRREISLWQEESTGIVKVEHCKIVIPKTKYSRTLRLPED